jgi:hypothetical protein
MQVYAHHCTRRAKLTQAAQQQAFVLEAGARRSRSSVIDKRGERGELSVEAATGDPVVQTMFDIIVQGEFEAGEEGFEEHEALDALDGPVESSNRALCIFV